LNFLIHDAEPQRKEILESGNYVEVENTFSAGFYDVLPTSPLETVQILELLRTLSTVSGRNAGRDSMGKYAKALTSLRTSDSDKAIIMWDQFTRKATNLDPRWTIYFLAEHGGGVVKAAMGDDKVAKGLLGFYTTQSQSRWKRIMEDRDEKDLEIKSLIPKFAQTMIEAISVRLCYIYPILQHLQELTTPSRTNNQSHQSTTNTKTLELTTHAIYSILTTSDSTRDSIPRSLTRKLMDFGDFANKKKKESKSKMEEEGWRGIRDMADILGDPKMRVEDIRLTWGGRDRSRSPVKALPPKEKPVERTNAPVSRPPQPQPQPQSQPQAPARSVAPPQQSRQAPTVPQAPIAPRAVAPTPTVRPATPPPPPKAIAKPAPEPAQPQGLNMKSKATPAAPSIKSTTPLIAPQVRSEAGPSTSTLNIRARATLPAIPAQKEEPVSFHPIPTLATQGLSIRSASTSTPGPLYAEIAPKPMSLLSRLAPAISTPTTSNKRSRAEDFTSTSTSTSTPNTPSQPEGPVRRSLADRLGGSDKKQRVTSNPEVGGRTPSLLSRMGQSQNFIPTSVSQTQSPSSRVQPNTAPDGFTIKRTAQPSPLPAPGQSPATTENGFSIKRSGSGLPTTSAVQSPGGFSIKNRSISSTSTPTQNHKDNGLQIKRTATPVQVTAPTVPVPVLEQQSKPKIEEDDAPIVRKGRGFAARSMGDGELLITPPNLPSGGNGGRLQDRFKLNNGR
jgi:hypothetical protein